MRYRLLSPSLLTLGAFGLAACGEETTQPNTAEDQPTVPQLAVASNTWLTRRNMPLDFVAQTTAVVPNAAGQSILYVMGGRHADRPQPRDWVPMGEVRAYNVATNTWTGKRDMPAARHLMNGSGVIKGKIYVTGGYGTRVRPSASVFVYDPASNTWSRKRDMPAAGAEGVTGVIGGKLYVFTLDLYTLNKSVNFFRYNPTTDSWTTLPKPTGSSPFYVGGGVINKKLYLIGKGVEAGSDEYSVLEYDPITNQWTKKRSWRSESCLPDPRYDCHLDGPSVVMLSHLYVFGREWYGFGASPGIFIYDPVSDTWGRKPLLTTLNYWRLTDLTAARVFLNGKPRVEVTGGYRPGNNQQYIP